MQSAVASVQQTSQFHFKCQKMMKCTQVFFSIKSRMSWKLSLLLQPRSPVQYVPQIRWAVVFIQTFFILIKPADEDSAPTFTTKHLDNQPISRIQVFCQERLMWPWPTSSRDEKRAAEVHRAEHRRHLRYQSGIAAAPSLTYSVVPPKNLLTDFNV